MSVEGLNFEGLNRELLSRARELLPEWLPGGRPYGSEYKCSNLSGGKGQSLSVNMQSGVWKDFASPGDAGSDLISLYAAVRKIGQGDAAKELAERLKFNLKSERRELPPPESEKPIPYPRIPLLNELTHSRFGNATKGRVWRYDNESGEILFLVARYDPSGEKKQFIPWTWWESKGGLQPKGWPAPRPLYRLHSLTLNPTSPVLICEGEKAADAALEFAGRAYEVTTWAGGAASFKQADWTPVYGRRILIWPDADEAGHTAAQGIAELLAPHCPEVKILEITDINGGWDAADSNFTWDEFKSWAVPRARTFQIQSSIETEKPEVLPADPDPPPYTTINNLTVNVEPEGEPLDESVRAMHERLHIAFSKNGTPIYNMDNTLRFLEGLPVFQDRIWFDEFHQKIFTRWNPYGADFTDAKIWTDAYDLALLAILQRNYQMSRLTKSQVQDAIIKYSHQFTRNEAKDWITSLKWDGTERLPTFMSRAYGAEDNSYNRDVGRNFLISIVARIMRPGCQVDNMVILEGKQGARKSSSLRILGGKFYAESSQQVGTNDFLASLHGIFLLEIGELQSFSKGETTRIKQVITCPVDSFRPPYGRHVQKFPRQCVLVGTTNEDDYLKDPTGGRRFWPVRTGKIDLEYITEFREQLFAEALHRYQQGEPWWEVEGAAEEQESRRHSDIWETMIAEFVSLGRLEVNIRQILTECLKIEPGRVTRGDEMRAAAALRAIGWVKGKQRMHDGLRYYPYTKG